MPPGRPLLRCLLAAALAAAPAAARAGADAVPGELIVKYRPGASASQRARAVSALPGAERARALPLIGAELVRVPPAETDVALAALAHAPGVEYAQPNHYVHAQVLPNDPSFNQQWPLLNTGQGGAYAGVDIDATLAWDLTTGDSTVRVGVLDTGIDYTHPDLAANVWTNPGEIPGNGLDDDGNGYADDVHGYDFVNLDGDPIDDQFHGTHVAGIVGAVGNDGFGISGVAWRCRMVAIKFLDAAGSGTEARAIEAIQYAIATGCRVTNNSWGNIGGGQALLDAIEAAGAAGQLMVFAAGNNGWNIDLVPFYPPTYFAPNMITVTSTDGRDLRPLLTNFGASTVHLGAPGLNVYSCKPGGLYQVLTGTSMAAPHVTGAIVLAMSRFPLAPAATVRRMVLDSAEPVASMSATTITGGRLNAYRLLQRGDALVGVGGPVPASFALRLASAQPSHGRAAMLLALPQAASMDVSVHDVGGRRLACLVRGRLGPGTHALAWDGRTDTGAPAGPGVFFVRATGGAGTAVLRLVRLDRR